MIDLQIIGHSIFRLESVDSTNNYAANMLNATKVGNGTVILAENQFGGKGQRGNTWDVESGKNLTFSIVLTDVNINAKHQFLISQWVSVALIELLKFYAVQAKIKWPNDILTTHSNEKLAGILIENTLQGDKIKNSIIGIGLNVNQLEFGKIKATSMAKCLRSEVSLEGVFQKLLQTLNQLYLQLQQNSNKITEHYFNNLLGYKQSLKYQTKAEDFLAEITTVLPDGRLVLRKDNGDEVTFMFKEVSLIL